MHERQLDLVFSALSDATRRGMLAQLSEGEANISALAAPYDISQPAISKHLRIEGVPAVEWKGATRPDTSLNGNMFSAISGANVIGLRLHRDDREEFLTTYQTTLFEGVPGFFQKEYVAMPSTMNGDTRTMRRWFRKSHAYVRSLKAKKTTR